MGKQRKWTQQQQPSKPKSNKKTSNDAHSKEKNKNHCDHHSIDAHTEERLLEITSRVVSQKRKENFQEIYDKCIREWATTDMEMDWKIVCEYVEIT
jgi:hypothetical protein